MMASDDDYRPEPSGLDDLADAHLQGSTRDFVLVLIVCVILTCVLGYVLGSGIVK